MFWPFLHKRYTDVMEDTKRIEKLLKAIKSETKSDDWAPIDGLVALTNADVKDVNGQRSADFNPGKGIPVKAFMNTKTGEIKIYTYEAVI